MLGAAIVTQGYGGEPTHNNQSYAVDFSVDEGTIVQAIADGTVVAIRNGSVNGDTTHGQFGNYVTILHTGGVYATYAHLSEATITLGPITSGQPIGYSGNTGRSEGPHLHIHFGTRLIDDGNFDRADGGLDAVPPAFFTQFFPAQELAGQIDLNNFANIKPTDIFGTAGDDGEAGPRPDNFHGSGSANRMFGGAGRDILEGRGGQDLLVGGSGNDRLNGDGGDDTLIGGTGADRLNGGLGRDHFVYRAPSEGLDQLTDFARKDVFDFSHLAFGHNLAIGNVDTGQLDPMHFIANSSGPSNLDQHFWFNTASDTLYYDADGSGPSESIAMAHLINGFNLMAVDIFLI